MPFNIIQAPTIISNSGLGDSLQVTTLSDGDYALTFSSANGVSIDATVSVFDAQGQPVGSSAVTQSTFEDLPSITALSGGGFALEWTDFFAGDLYTAVFNAQGLEITPPIDVSATLNHTGNVLFPVLTALSTGGYAVTWDQDTTAGNVDIFTSVYNAQGQAVTGPVDVSNAASTNDQGPAVVKLSNGNYALAWSSSTTVAGVVVGDTFTAVYDAQGQQVAAPVNVSNTGISGEDVKIAALSNGGYALTWTGADAGNNLEIFVAVYDGQGQQVVAPFVAGAGLQPQIAALANGNYALFWSGGHDVFTAVYDAQGIQVSAPVNVSNDNHGGTPASVTALSNGDYALTWQAGDGTQGGVPDVFTAVYSAQGQQLVAPVDVSNSPNLYDTFCRGHGAGQWQLRHIVASSVGRRH